MKYGAKTDVGMKRKNKLELQRRSYSFKIIGSTFIIGFTILALYPFLLLLAGSFTSEAAIYKYGFSLIPKEFSFAAYSMIFKSPDKNAVVLVIGTTNIIPLPGFEILIFSSASDKI